LDERRVAWLDDRRVAWLGERRVAWLDERWVQRRRPQDHSIPLQG
jgi:hypothetical protein